MKNNDIDWDIKIGARMPDGQEKEISAFMLILHMYNHLQEAPKESKKETAFQSIKFLEQFLSDILNDFPQECPESIDDLRIAWKKGMQLSYFFTFYRGFSLEFFPNLNGGQEEERELKFLEYLNRFLKKEGFQLEKNNDVSE